MSYHTLLHVSVGMNHYQALLLDYNKINANMTSDIMLFVISHIATCFGWHEPLSGPSF